MKLAVPLALILLTAPGFAAPPPPKALQKWRTMPKNQKQQELKKLPPDRQKKLEQRLDNYQNLPQQQRDALDARYHNFQKLPPAQQERARAAFRRFQNLSPERQQKIRQEWRKLQSLPAAERERRLKSPDFQKTFNPSERGILEDFSHTIPNGP